MSEEKILKELKAINKRLERIEKCYKAVAIISTWISCFDPRFETTGELIKHIKNLCEETLRGKK